MVLVGDGLQTFRVILILATQEFFLLSTFVGNGLYRSIHHMIFICSTVKEINTIATGLQLDGIPILVRPPSIISTEGCI